MEILECTQLYCPSHRGIYFWELLSPSRPFGVVVRFGRPQISNGPKTCVLVVLPAYFLLPVVTTEYRGFENQLIRNKLPTAENSYSVTNYIGLPLRHYAFPQQ